MSQDDDIELTEDQVARYLKNHPAFFISRDDLLLEMKIPHDNGSAISLVERQVNILRERNLEFRHRLNKLLDVAKENGSLFEKTRSLVLKLLESTTLNTVLQATTDSLANDFKSDLISLILFDDLFDHNQVDRTQFPSVRVETQTSTQEHLENLLKGKKAICGVLRKEELEHLFGHDGNSVRSAALVPIVYKGSQGILAIGSLDPDHFRSSLDTLFITHIGDVLARTLYQHQRRKPAAISA